MLLLFITYYICGEMRFHFGLIETTAWLAGAYDFYARVVKGCLTKSERSERVSLAIFHNKCILKVHMKIAQTTQPYSNLFTPYVLE